MFSIRFTNEPLEYPFDDKTIPCAPGMLVLGNWFEEILANLSVWSKADYEAHWVRELDALVKRTSKVALIVSYNDPRFSSNMEIWRVYREGEWAHFQNQIPDYGSFPQPFKIEELSQLISDRRVMNDEGDRISEWKVSVREIEYFLLKCERSEPWGLDWVR
jgi:contact-dependent growth inhibition (CDI) system CdiI-like immunity protein